MEEHVWLAIDVGGTTIKYGLIDQNKNLTHRGKSPTKQNHNNAILKELMRLVSSFSKAYKLDGVGISTAGIVDRVNGKIIYAGPTIPNYINTEIKATLEKEFTIPVYVENDVNAALLGEQLCGTAQGRDDIFCVALGTGIGGAYLKDGRLVDGSHYQANSIGYLLFDPETKTNYEQRASTLILEKELMERQQISVPNAFALARTGRRDIEAVIDGWVKRVAQGLAEIILLFDPKMLLIGGGVSAQGAYLAEKLETAVPLYLPPNFYKTEIKTAQLGNDAALFGAVAPFLEVHDLQRE